MAASNDGGMKKFLIPEKELSLKLIFDNVRNYAIIGAIFVAVRWLQHGQIAGPLILTHGTADGTKLSYIFIGIGLALAILNACQTILLIRRLVGFDREPSGAPKYERVGWPWYAHVLEYIAALCLSLTLIACFFAIGTFVLFFTWFPVGSMH